jgi:hypothetical protein
MLQFKAPQDLNNLPDSHPAYPLVQDLINRLIVNFPEDRAYAPDDDCWICLIEEHDVDRVLSGVWADWTLADILWEGIRLTDSHYQAGYLADNEKGFVFLIPGAPWLPDSLRESIEYYLDP